MLSNLVVACSELVPLGRAAMGDFALFDKTGKGKIEKADLQEALNTLHIEASPAYVDALMAEADANKVRMPALHLVLAPRAHIRGSGHYER